MRFDEKAKKIFGKDFNCAQSVLAPFAERFGLEEATALKLTTPFGGGIYHHGQVCGAVTGALLAIGLAEGFTGEDISQKQICKDLSMAFLERFEVLHGALTCPDLLGLKWENWGDLDKAMTERSIFANCSTFVADAAKIAAELLEIEK